MLFYARDDEELVDQKKYLEERCKPQCVKSLYEYDVCALFLLWELKTSVTLLFNISFWLVKGFWNHIISIPS